jgi:hypothetical protein
LQLNIRRISRNRIIDLRDFKGPCGSRIPLAPRLFRAGLTTCLGARHFLLQLSSNAFQLGLVLRNRLFALFLLLDHLHDNRRQGDVADQNLGQENALLLQVITRPVY